MKSLKINQILTKIVQNTVLASTLLLVFACGRASGPPSSVIAQSRSYDSEPHQALPLPDDPARQSFVVSPELAVMMVKLSTTQATFEASTQLLQDKASLLLSEVGAGEGCKVDIVDYRQPVQSGTYLRWDADQYTSQMNLAIEISFETLTSVTERMQQLDNCVQRIPTFIHKDTKQEEAIAVALSPAMPTIRDASVHRDDLLQRRFAPLQAVAVATQPPEQFKAAHTQCTSNGTVEIVARTLSGIELDVHFECSTDDVDPLQ